MCLELLLPVNEVWGKIMFLNVSVILSGGRGLPTGRVCLRGSAYREGSAYRGSLPTEGGIGQSPPTQCKTRKRSGTHPTGMLPVCTKKYIMEK